LTLRAFALRHDAGMSHLLRAARHELRIFFIALQFLTRVPVPVWVGWHPQWLQSCLRHFPMVGALVGLWGALVLVLAAQWWPPTVAVVLSMAATVWVTGAFHEDGWADTCDALGGHVSRERALVIMKDSRIGAYGALGLMLMLGLKAAALVSLASPHLQELNSAETSHIRQVLLAWTTMALVWCHAASRLVPVVLIYLLPYAGDADHAKVKPLAVQASGTQLLAAMLGLAVVAGVMWLWLFQVGWPTGTLRMAMGRTVVAVVMATALCHRWFLHRLGGFTGDALGASQQLSEVMALLAWLSVVHPVAA
jgi:adenosylcobinamide-GDP ribazoletransferase